MRCRYRARSRHAVAPDLRVRLDNVLRERVPVLCGPLFAERLPPGDGVVVIRRLDLKLVLSRRLDEPRAAALWARAMKIALTRALAEGTGERVVRFASAAEQLAVFVEDLVAGTAWTKWYHETFSSVRGLAPSLAARRTLVDRRDVIPATLRILRRRGRLRSVLTALTDEDAWAIFAAAPSSGGGSPAQQVLVPERLREALSVARPPLVALHLLTDLAEADALSPRNVEAAGHLGRVAPPLLERRPGAGDVEGLVATAESAGEATARSLRALQADEPALLRRAASATSDSSAPPVDDDGDEFVTAYGGAFLLLPALAELDVEARLVAGGLAEDEAARAGGVGRWLVLVKCLEPAARSTAKYDRGLVVAAGLGAAPDDAALRRLGRVTRARVASALVCGLTPSASTGYFRTNELAGARRADAAWSFVAGAALDMLARKLPGFMECSPGHLARNFLAGSSLVQVNADGVIATLPSAPLEIVFRVAGWAGSRYSIPWLPGGALHLRGEEE